jgi:hypothetical protein
MRSHAALAALLAVVIGLAVASVRLDSACPDEPAHVANGVIKLTEGWLNFFREQPPLMNSLSAAPVVLAGYRIQPGWKGGNHWVVGRRFLYRSGYDWRRILFLARLPTIALFAGLVAVVYWFVFRQSGNGWWALLAAGLTGFCPNLIAHGRLATVDMALTFFAFASTALLITMLARPSPLVAILFGITAAAAPMAKVSGVILAPYFAIVVVAAFLSKRVSEPRRFLAALAVSIVTALLFFTLFGLAVTSDAYARAEYPGVPRLLVSFAEYLANIRTINAWYSKGHELPQFLMGEFSPTGWRHYYLVALLLKTPIPAILLTVGALVAGARRRSFPFLALLFFALLFLGFAAAGHLALGVRYVLPVYPFFYAAIPLALSGREIGRVGIAVVAALAVWHAAENLRAYPSYIAYFNQLIGSHRNADRFLIDSNLDWGQDLRRLDRWAGQNGVKELAVHYFGGGDVEYEIRSARPIVRYGPGPDLLPVEYFALSRHFYRLSFYPPLWGADYDEYLAASKARYLTTIGGSIDVYRVDRAVP